MTETVWMVWVTEGERNYVMGLWRDHDDALKRVKMFKEREEYSRSWCEDWDIE